MVTSNATSESAIKSYEIEMDPVNEKLLKEQTLEILKDLRPKWDLNLLEFKVYFILCYKSDSYYLIILDFYKRYYKSNILYYISR
jgi:hypothetical protein